MAPMDRECSLVSGEYYATTFTQNQKSDENPENSYTACRPGHHSDFFFEKFRFTTADNPRHIERASENVGSGHTFYVQRSAHSHVLVYVVDLSAGSPWAHREELEKKY